MEPHTSPTARIAPSDPVPRRGSINIFATKIKADIAAPGFIAGDIIAEEDARRPPKIRSQTDDSNKVKVDRQKQDAAMAKWRTWVNEQPDAPAMEAGPSRRPPKPRQPYSPKETIPLVPMRTSSASTQPSGSSHKPNPRRTSSHERSHNYPSPPLAVYSPTRSVVASPRLSYGDDDVYYNSETARALQDVELAVDVEVLAAARRKRDEPAVRRLSSRPRVSPVENPFIDIVGRMGSRRVRPIVLELLHALGCWIDAVWSISHPSQPCPWGKTATTTESSSWTSPILGAILDARSNGFLVDRPTVIDADFWQEESHHSILDVDEVVGIVKGLGWAFSAAMSKGDYRVESDNIILPNGRPGDVPRLLNDLEEVIWGDAPPRPTDLAYDLPDDFDIYSSPDLADIVTNGVVAASHAPISTNPLVAFFAESSPGPQFQFRSPSAITPDMVGSPATAGVAPSPELPPLNGASRFPVTNGASNFSNLIGLGIDSSIVPDGMTLKELGQQRHREWLRGRSNGHDVGVVVA